MDDYRHTANLFLDRSRTVLERKGQAIERDPVKWLADMEDAIEIVEGLVHQVNLLVAQIDDSD